LALSEASNLGPFQAGAVIGLLEELERMKKPSHNIVSGVTLGALNANIYSQYKMGEEEGVIDHLKRFWTELG
jgi:predicted acylesterase/phospholipase RssA